MHCNTNKHHSIWYHQKLECTFIQLMLYCTKHKHRGIVLLYRLSSVYLLLLLLAMNIHAPCCCCCFYRTNIRHIYSPLSNVDFHWIENGIKSCNHIALENKSCFVVIAMISSVCRAVKSNNMQRKSNKKIHIRFIIFQYHFILFYIFFFEKTFWYFFTKKDKKSFCFHFSHRAWFEKHKYFCYISLSFE